MLYQRQSFLTTIKSQRVVSFSKMYTVRSLFFQVFTCDWWYNVNCAASETMYNLNDNLYRVSISILFLKRIIRFVSNGSSKPDDQNHREITYTEENQGVPASVLYTSLVINSLINNDVCIRPVALTTNLYCKHVQNSETSLFGPVESGKGDDFDLSQLKALLQVTLIKLLKKEF